MVPLKVVLLVAVFGSANTVAAREIGLILHYSFDEGAIQDRSGYSNDGEAIGDAKWVSGEFGSALEFNGKDTYVDCGAKASLNADGSFIDQTMGGKRTRPGLSTRWCGIFDPTRHIVEHG